MSSALSNGASVGLRSQYEELTSSEIANGNTSNGSVTANTKDTAVRLIKLSQISKVFFIDNSTNQEVEIWAVGPEEKTRARVLLVKLGGGKQLNYELAANNLQIEAGIEVWVSAPVSPSSGKVSMFTWG